MKNIDRVRPLAAALLAAGALACALPAGAEEPDTAAAGQSSAAPGVHETPAPVRRRPAARQMTEAQALQALELELSRNVGKQINEADFPEEARRWNWSGTTLVQVLMGADGSMKEVSVRKTSGFRALDEQALLVVRRIAVPLVPERLRGREVTVTVPIGFYFGEQ
jgi:protein TonB